MTKAMAVFALAWPGDIGLALGSGSHGQPSPRNGNKREPVEARIGTAFSKIFRCTPDGDLVSARGAIRGSNQNAKKRR